MQAFNEQNELDTVYALMLDAIEGQLSDAQEEELASYLLKYPDLATELDSMKGHTPFAERFTCELATPSTAFVEETVAYLPNLRLRRYIMGSFAGLLIIVSILPFAGLFLLVANASMALIEAFLSGLAQIIYNAGYSVITQPITLAIVAFMLGSILLWSTMYRRMVLRPVVVTN